jgi:hypothetical protein
VFAIAKSGRPYDESYVSMLPNINREKSFKKAQRISFMNP